MATHSNAKMYLRIPRMISFGLTSALCNVVLGLASKGLADGIHKKQLAAKMIPGAKLIIGDILGSGGAVTAASGIASILCLIMSILLIFHPHRAETMRSIQLKEAAFAFSAVFWLATLIPSTVIVATRSGVIRAPGIPEALILGLVKASGQNLAYKAQKVAVAYTIVGWIAFLSTLVNLALVSMASRHMHKFGSSSTATHDGMAVPASTMSERGHTSMDKTGPEHREL